MIGAMNALPLMLESRRIDPAAALGMGIVQQTVPAAELLAAAKAWIAANPHPRCAVGPEGFPHSGGGPFSASGAQVFTVGNAMLRQRTYDNYPAQRFIMSAVYEGLLVDIDTALKIEARYFVRALLSPNSKAMIRTLFHSMQELGKGARRPKEVARTEVKRLGVLGAGVMGSGIAYVSALAGIDVTLIDTTGERAEGGKELMLPSCSTAKFHAAGLRPRAKTKCSARIHPETRFEALRDVDLVIEAVFEDRKVKAEATKKTDAVHAGHGDLRLQHLHSPDHRTGAGKPAAGKLHRHPFLLARRAHGSGRDHRRQADGRPGARHRHRLRRRKSARRRSW